MWRRIIEVSGPTSLLGVDAANPSPYPLRTRVVRDPPPPPPYTSVLELIFSPYAYPAFSPSYIDIDVRQWRWNPMLHDRILVPEGSKIAFEMEDPPPFANGFFLLEGGFVVQSQVSDAPDRP
jgi:hypothetical protein